MKTCLFEKCTYSKMRFKKSVYSEPCINTNKKRLRLFIGTMNPVGTEQKRTAELVSIQDISTTWTIQSVSDLSQDTAELHTVRDIMNWKIYYTFQSKSSVRANVHSVA